MPDAVPGLNIRRCPWVKTNRESQRRKMTHAQALDWLVIVSRTVGDEGCNYKAWHLVQLTWQCVESSASGSYCDLQAEELALLELLREDYASAKHILDAPWCHGLLSVVFHWCGLHHSRPKTLRSSVAASLLQARWHHVCSPSSDHVFCRLIRVMVPRQLQSPTCCLLTSSWVLWFCCNPCASH